MTAEGFLRELWGRQPPGLILLWSLRDKRSRYLQSPAGAVALPPGEPDVYTGVGLAHKDHGPQRRTSNDLVCAIAGLWADIDVDGGPDRKTGACPTWDAAYATATALAEPTLLVHSGHGLQGWWLFEGGAWRFKTRSEQRQAASMSAQWQALLRQRSGHGLDYTHDLARVLRLPGTRNGKDPSRHVHVEVIEEGGPRHERDELAEIASAAGEVSPGYAIGTARTPLNVVLRAADSRAAEALLQRSPQFARTWRHEREELASMSEIDLSLASIAALAGYTDQQIADVIASHRAEHNDPKGSRLDYLRRTVVRARAGESQPEPAAVSSTRPGTFLGEQWAQAIRRNLRSQTRLSIPLPFVALSHALDGGITPGDVVLIAGYTSHGKSVFVDMIADAAAAEGKRVHLYLTEMTAYERGLRLLARRASVPFRRLRRRELDARDWKLIEAQLTKLPYGCSVVSDWGVEDVVAHIVENRWDLAVVDLIHGFAYNDERELSKTSSAMVRAAKATASDGHPGTAIVVAAHLNDGQMRDQRSARRPQPGLHSIKGSSSLKQDADVVMFVWQQDDDDGTPTGSGAIWIAKARQGGLGKVSVTLDVASMRFVELP